MSRYRATSDNESDAYNYSDDSDFDNETPEDHPTRDTTTKRKPAAGNKNIAICILE